MAEYAVPSPVRNATRPRDGQFDGFIIYLHPLTLLHYVVTQNKTEVSHMQYTAATVSYTDIINDLLLAYGPPNGQCNPEEFTRANHWSLRVSKYDRPTEILIGITSQNQV